MIGRAEPVVVEFDAPQIVVGMGGETVPRGLVSSVCAKVVAADGGRPHVVRSRAAILAGAAPDAELVDLLRAPGECFTNAASADVLRAALTEELQAHEIDSLEQRCCIFTLPQHWSTLDITEQAIKFFLGLGFAGVYAAQRCVVAALRCGLPSAIVVDIGSCSSSITAVVDGQAMLRGRGISHAAALCSARAALAASLANCDTARPATAAAASATDGNGGGGALALSDTLLSVACGDDGGEGRRISPDVAAFALSELADEMRRVATLVNPRCSVGAGGRAVAEATGIPPSVFRTPRGTEVCVPPALRTAPYEPWFTGDMSLPRLVVAAKRAVDCEMQAVMPVVVASSGPAVAGIDRRLHEELKRLDATFHRQQALVAAPRHVAWEGASLLCTTPAFEAMWVTQVDALSDLSAALRKKLFLA